MRLKLDEDLGPRLGEDIALLGHDVATVLSEGLSGAADERIYSAARSESRTLVTLDLDFANPLRFPVSGTAGVIVVRPARPVVGLIRQSLLSALGQIEGSGASGRLWIAEPGRLRLYEPRGDGASGLPDAP